MDMGHPSNARAHLDALIATAAPDPLPAEQAIALLQLLGETDAAVLGRLAYHALTGVDPGEGDPTPPAEVVPGFPPFAAEVLMRAISGPDHRRPTAQALLIVLDTVPAASWPSAAPVAAVAEPEPEPVVEAEPEPEPEPVVEAEPEPEPEPEPVVEAEPEPVVEAEPEPVVERVEHDEFRSLLTPTRTVPRFDPLTDPLTDPWVPDDADDLPPLDLSRVTGSTSVPVEPVHEPVHEPEPVAEEPEPVPVEPEPVAEEPEPVAEEPGAQSSDEPEDEPSDEPEDDDRGMHDEFRNFVSPTFAIPHFEPLEGELPAGSDRVRRRRTRGRDKRRAEKAARRAAKTARAEEPQPAKEPQQPKAAKAAKAAKEPKPEKVAHDASSDDRHQTLLLVAVIVVLVVLGVVYAASRDSEDAKDDNGSPQGASRSMVQPVSAAV